MKKESLFKKYQDELGFIPTIKYVLERALREYPWPNNMVNAIILEGVIGISKRMLSGEISSASASGLIEQIGVSTHGLKVYRVVKKE